MKKVILVLTNSEDGEHSDVVIGRLLERGEDVFRFDTDRFSRGEITISFTPSSDGGDCLICDGKRMISSGDVKSAWYRRPNHFALPLRDLVQKAYAESEIRVFLDAAWHMLEKRDIFFLSKPTAIEMARQKPLQLNLAKRYGMRIPRTIITNDPNRVRQFERLCPNGMIFKAVHHEFLNYGEKSYNVPTTLVTPQLFEKIDLVRRSPAIFQEFIQKAYELRVTIVGQSVFPVKIDSQGNPLTVVDWRNPLCIDKLDYSATEIEPRIRSFCFEILGAFGLQFGAFDFIVGKDGEVYFLEVNPNGQWYWLEDMAGVLISDAIADMLISDVGRG